MPLSRVAIVVAFVLVLVLPFLVRPAGSGNLAPTQGKNDATLIIITPHVGQIRDEFGAAFARWHARHFPGEPPVFIDWRVPGGTTEIRKQLQAEYEAAAKSGARDGTAHADKWNPDHTSCELALAPRSMGADLLFGGGHYEHDVLRTGVTVRVQIDGKDVSALVRISEPAGFEPSRLTGAPDSWFTANKIGNQELYEKDQYWIGVALSSFGIVYNRELVRERGLSDPTSFQDLGDFRYLQLLALADPRQSGSVTTTFESILNKEGWDEGWRVLRELGANGRSFASSSTKPPVDVSQGEALAGLAIDFYGRSQAQALLAPGQSPDDSRVGYVDPRGAVYVDADPISVLQGCPHPELARRFLEFSLSEEGQALWQLPPLDSPAGKNNPPGADGKPLGPQKYALRRMPARQAMYAKYLDHFVDHVNPFEIAAPLPDRRWRRAIDVMMGAFAVDTQDDLRAAWIALHRCRADSQFPRETLAEMERLFYAFPRGADIERLAASLFPGLELPPDAKLDFSAEVTDKGDAKRNPKGDDNCRRISATWSNADAKARLRVIYTEYFRASYRRVVELGSRRSS